MAPKSERAVDLMLDSGAFSAWKRGEQINVKNYIDFVTQNSALLHCYVNLDAIPGRPGRSATQQEVEEAAAASLNNYQAMRAAGLDPIPVFHMGENLDWLRRILDSGAEWIGLGGSVGKPEGERYRFFEKCFGVIATYDNAPRVHGFGATTIQTMIKFPWYSVDSTSWVMASAMGSILVPAATLDGGCDFTRLRPVRVSGEGNQNWQAAGFGVIYRKHLDVFLAGRGLTLAHVRSDQSARNRVNIYSLREAATAAGVLLFFSTWMAESWHQAPQLTESGARERLISYYELCCYRRDLSYHLPQYVRKGYLSAKAQLFSMKQFDRAVYRSKRIAALVARGEVVA